MMHMIDVYQAKPGTKYIFMPWANAKNLFDFGQDYTKAYSQIMVGAVNQDKALGQAFAMLNRDDRPNAQTARSASMSDVFVISDGTKATAFYCDTLGWTDVSDKVFNNLFTGPGQPDDKKGET